ncbi:MAG: transketolase C-terminal domain-containing protein [Streptosporangiaceae bacterium]
MRNNGTGEAGEQLAPAHGEPPAAWLADVCAEVRRRMLESCLAAGTGHVGGCSGAVELLTGLYFGGVLRYDPQSPADPGRDRVIVRGHLGPVRYAIFSLLGWVAEDELAEYATLGSRLQGHETPGCPGVDFGPSGSLGMLLSYGVGSAIVAASSPRPWRTFVFLGDGEEQEGNVAEAARHAASIQARGLIAIIDANGHQLSGPTSHADAADLAVTWRGYGWQVIELAGGNDVLAVTAALRRGAALSDDDPVMILASTRKGYAISGADAHFSGYHELGHGDPALVRDAARSIPRRALEFHTLTDVRDSSLPGAIPLLYVPPRRSGLPARESWPDHPDSFQLAYLTDLAGMWRERDAERLYFLFADTFPEPLLDRTGLASAGWCGNVGIREQHLIALAHAISQADPSATVIAHTGDPFIPRAMDQLMAAASVGSRFILIGDDAGITNARNGASHQSSAHPLLLSALDGIECFEPADGYDFAAPMSHALSLETGICYVRVHDGTLAAPLSVPPERRSIGWYQVRQPGGTPDVLLAASGFMTGQAASAASLLASEGISASVISVVQPSLAGEAVAEAGEQGVPVLTVYDGLPGVLGNPVLAAKATSQWSSPVQSLGFRRGRSGRLDELLAWAGLDSCSIARSAAALLAGGESPLNPTGAGAHD